MEWNGHRRYRATGPASALLVLFATCPLSQAVADAARGKTLAAALCARCHLNEGQGEKQGPMGVPGFRAVANRPGQSLIGIVEWLRSVPPMMPDHRLTKDEAEALAAYILSLRVENGVPAGKNEHNVQPPAP